MSVVTRARLSVWLGAVHPWAAWPLRALLVAVLAAPVLLEWGALFVLRAVAVVLGVPVVLLALPLRIDHTATARPFTDAESAGGVWRWVSLPAWAWLWSNDRDGAAGDKRGWWDRHAPFGLGAYHWWSMFWWLAIRNPVGNMRYLPPFGLDVQRSRAWYFGQESVEDDPGAGGFRFLIVREGLVVCFGLYWVREYRLPAWLQGLGVRLADRWPRLFGGLPAVLAAPRALVIQLGNKAEPSDWAEDYAGDPSRAWKGTTFEVNPWKAI